MGLLDQLWDETVAGPRPEIGLSKLRKHASFSPSSANEYHEIAVTRSITILRTSSLRCPSLDSFSNNSSPAVSSSPSSPFSPKTPRADPKKRRKPTDDGGEPQTPTGYDWLPLLPFSCQQGVHHFPCGLAEEMNGQDLFVKWDRLEGPLGIIRK